MERNYILADNQDVTRVGLISFLKEIDGTATISEVTTYSQLMENLHYYPQSVVIIDYSLFNFLSIHQMLNIKSSAKQSTWLLFSNEPEEQFLRQLLISDNTISVVTKQSTKEEIKEALINVINRDIYWCEYADTIMSFEVKQSTIDTSLTVSEKIILQQIALGKTTKEIAVEKNLSFHTVNAHRRNIYSKLGVNSANEATRFALKAGIIDLIEYYI